MPLEAKGKSFNALKPLEVLPLKDSPWNQLGWCVSPYEGAYQSGLPVKGVSEKERERERDKVGEEDGVIERASVSEQEGMCTHLDVGVYAHAYVL